MVKGLYITPAAEYMERIMGQIEKEAAEDAKYEEEEAELDKALKEMDRKFRKEAAASREKQKREINNILAGLFSGLKIK